MRKIEELDLLIIERFEKITHFIQRNTGVDNFDLIYVLAVLISLFPFYHFDNIEKSTALFFLFWIFAYFPVIKDIPKIKEKVYKDLEKGQKNYLVVENLGARFILALLFFCCLYIFAYKNKVVNEFTLFLLIESYLCSCTPVDTCFLKKDGVPDTA